MDDGGGDGGNVTVCAEKGEDAVDGLCVGDDDDDDDGYRIRQNWP
jgi:hypothetical protein